MPVATKPTLINAWGNTNTTSPDMVAPTYVDSGFPAPGGIPVKPPRGYINWLFNFLTNAVRYFMQRGISGWDAGEDGYQAGSVVRSNGILYQLVGTATTGASPQLDPLNWLPLLTRDPMGLPIGRYYEWLETWAAFGVFTNSGGTGETNYSGRWQHKLTGSDTSARLGALTYAPSIPTGQLVSPGGPPNISHGVGLFFDVGKNAGDYARVRETFPLSVLDDDVLVSIETTMAVNDNSDVTWIFGFTSGNDEIDSINDGALFWINPGDSNWQARTILAGTPNDLALAPPTAFVGGPSMVPHRFKIICRGASMGFGGRQIQFYIDEVLVGVSNAELPFFDALGGTGFSPYGIQTIMGGVTQINGASVNTGYFGPVRYAQRFTTL